MSHLVPVWFAGYDILLEAVFALVTFAVGLLAFRVYRRSDEQQAGLLSAAFFTISASYAVLCAFNASGIEVLRTPSMEELHEFLILHTVGTYLQAVLMLVGLSTLLYMTFKEPRRLYWLLTFLSVIPFLYNPSTGLFFLTATILLGFILAHYVQHYLRHKQPRTLLITLAFFFLFIGKAHFVLGVNFQVFYAIGHVLELVAYLLILANLVLVLRK